MFIISEINTLSYYKTVTAKSNNLLIFKKQLCFFLARRRTYVYHFIMKPIDDTTESIVSEISARYGANVLRGGVRLRSEAA